MEMQITDESIIERFMDATIIGDDNECWLWAKGYNNKNRGYFYCEGRTQIAARVAYRIHKGPIPDGLLVMHSCDNTMCVNPKHLSVGTNKDNVDDMVSKGRRAPNIVKGSNHGSARLNEDKVKCIRLMLEAGYTKASIAHEYGVSDSTISDIATGKTWSHV